MILSGNFYRPNFRDRLSISSKVSVSVYLCWLVNVKFSLHLCGTPRQSWRCTQQPSCYIDMKTNLPHWQWVGKITEFGIAPIPIYQQLLLPANQRHFDVYTAANKSSAGHQLYQQEQQLVDNGGNYQTCCALFSRLENSVMVQYFHHHV